jgi:type II secretory pathway pseudopilin PulG
VEVLTVITIMGVLVALILPAIHAARQSAARHQCQNNLRQLGLGLTAHAVAHGYLPGGGATSVVQDPRGLSLRDRVFDRRPATSSGQAWGCLYQVLPYVERFR